MHVIICLVEKDGIKYPMPIMHEGEDASEVSDYMATWEEYNDAVKFCGRNILCRSKENIIIDINNGEISFE